MDLIEQLLDLTNYATPTRAARRKTGKNTQEFFTPYSIVKRMADKISDEDWADPEKTFLESSAGNGQFVIYILWNRIQHGVDYMTALKTCYSVELMQDNVDEMYDRIYDLLDKLGIEYDYNEVMRVLKHNYVCSDFFKWDFEHWKPLKEKPKKVKSKNPVPKQLSLF